MYEWEEREVSRLKVLLMSVTDLCIDLEDKPVWLVAGSSVFSVSSAYRSEVDSLGPFLFSSKLFGTNLHLQRFNFSVG